MPRSAKIVVPDTPHHITQRGNRREDVFFADGDRRAYLSLLGSYCGKHEVDLLAYCLMTNHVHLVAVPREAGALSAALNPVHLRYAQHVNASRGIWGRLWQGRFYSCPMDEAHLWAAIRYVERNPVRAGMVSAAEAYPWSSAAAHCGLRTDPLLSDPFGLAEPVPDGRAWLAEGDGDGHLDRLRRHKFTGRPLGSDGFLDRIEAVLGSPVRPGKPGRPRKSGGEERKYG